MSTLVPEGQEWGICITHDVDHLSHKEHSFWEIFKFCATCKIETLRFRRTPWSYLKVVKNSVFTKKDSWDCIDELCDLDFSHMIPSTFFFAMNQGTGIKYTREQVREKVKRIPVNFEIGVHGQFQENEKEIKDEFATLYNMLVRRPHGIRMHYLRQSENMFKLLENTGYEYDSTEYDKTGELKQPYKKSNGLVEIPVHLMDTYLFSPFYDNLKLKKAIEKMEALIEKARKENKIINIIIHQRSISEDFPRQRKFYNWLLEKVSKDTKCWKTNCMEITKRINER